MQDISGGFFPKGIDVVYVVFMVFQFNIFHRIVWFGTIIRSLKMEQNYLLECSKYGEYIVLSGLDALGQAGGP